jgi:hypothetical protein
LYGTAGIGSATMLDKLRRSDAYIRQKDTMRFSTNVRSSAYIYSTTKLNLDLWKILDELENEHTSFETTETTQTQAKDDTPF